MRDSTGKHTLLKSYKWIIMGISLLLFIGLFEKQVQAAYEIPLSTGWNLISIPEQQTDITIDVVTGSIAGKFKSIWAYSNDSWTLYDPNNAGFSDLTTMDASRGYWINMESSGTLIGSGMKASSTVQLSVGWNLIGYNGNSTKTIADAIGAISGNIESIWAMENGQWKSYIKGSPGMSDLSQMKIGFGYWVNVTTPCSFSVDVNIPDSSKAISINDQNTTIAEITDTKITFTGNSAFINNLAVGQVISAPPSTQAPGGFLRNVTAIERIVNGALVTTTNATFGDAIQSGAGGLGRQLTYQDINFAKLKLPPGVKFATKSQTLWALEFGEEVEIEVEIDGVKVKFSGSIDFPAPSLIMNLQMENSRVKEFRVLLSGTEKSTFSTTVTSTGELPDNWRDFKIEGLTIPLTPQVIFIGWVPVVFTPQITFYVGLSGSITATLTAKITQTANYLAGVEYVDTHWRPVTNFSNRFDLSGDACLNGNLKAYAGPHLEVLVYGLAGPWVGLHPFIEADATLCAQAGADWGIYAGLDFAYGLVVNPYFNIDAPSAEPVQVVRYKIYPPENGHVSGTVKGENLIGLQGVSVQAVKQGTVVGQPVTTDQNGSYSLDLASGDGYVLKFSKAGFYEEKIQNVVITPGQGLNLANVIMVTQGFGSISGVITDAFSGQPVQVANAKILFRRGLNAQTGAIIRTASISASNGTYALDNMPSGTYTGETQIDGYIKNYIVVYCLANQNTPMDPQAVTPYIDAREIRIVLTWGATPNDLDSHLTGPIAGSASRFHVYYMQKNATTANLDLDDTTSYGPETVTITERVAGTYRYSVHDFTDRYSTNSSVLANSNALINVFKGSSLWTGCGPFNVPNRPGTLWTVFELKNLTATPQCLPINTMVYESAPAGVQSVDPESELELFRNLPDKK